MKNGERDGKRGGYLYIRKLCEREGKEGMEGWLFI
jgi:hypothetical protein